MSNPFKTTCYCIALLGPMLGLCITVQANAQTSLPGDAPTPQTQSSGPAMSALISAGFEIKAMQYLPQSMVFVLQRQTQAYICDTDFQGSSKLCIRIG